MAATPSGRVPPSGFGMFTRRDGVARYAPVCTRSCRSARRPSSPSSYIRHVIPSAPAAASLFNSKNAQRSASTVIWWRSVVRRSVVPVQRIAVSGRPLVTRFPGPVSGACFGFPDSPRARPFAPPTPPELASPCSSASRLLHLSLTSPCRSSSATDSSFLLRPRHDGGMAWRPPRSRCSAYVRVWILRPRGIPARLAISAGRMLSSAEGKTSTSRTIILSMLNSPTRTRPCQRLTPTLASGGP